MYVLPFAETFVFVWKMINLGEMYTLNHHVILRVASSVYRSWFKLVHHCVPPLIDRYIRTFNLSGFSLLVISVCRTHLKDKLFQNALKWLFEFRATYSTNFCIFNILLPAKIELYYISSISVEKNRDMVGNSMVK